MDFDASKLAQGMQHGLEKASNNLGQQINGFMASYGQGNISRHNHHMMTTMGGPEPDVNMSGATDLTLATAVSLLTASLLLQ